MDSIPSDDFGTVLWDEANEIHASLTELNRLRYHQAVERMVDGSVYGMSAKFLAHVRHFDQVSRETTARRTSILRAMSEELNFDEPKFERVEQFLTLIRMDTGGELEIAFRHLETFANTGESFLEVLRPGVLSSDPSDPFEDADKLDEGDTDA